VASGAVHDGRLQALPPYRFDPRLQATPDQLELQADTLRCNLLACSSTSSPLVRDTAYHHRHRPYRLHLDGLSATSSATCAGDRNRRRISARRGRLHRERRMNALEIKTHYQRKPGPLAELRLVGLVEDEESDGRVGYGSTREEAIGDLAVNFPRNGGLPDARPKSGYFNAAGQPIPGTHDITGRYKEMGGLMNWAYSQGKKGVPLYQRDALRYWNRRPSHGGTRLARHPGTRNRARTL